RGKCGWSERRLSLAREAHYRDHGEAVRHSDERAWWRLPLPGVRRVVHFAHVPEKSLHLLRGQLRALSLRQRRRSMPYPKISLHAGTHRFEKPTEQQQKPGQRSTHSPPLTLAETGVPSICCCRRRLHCHNVLTLTSSGRTPTVLCEPRCSPSRSWGRMPQPATRWPPGLRTRSLGMPRRITWSTSPAPGRQSTPTR